MSVIVKEESQAIPMIDAQPMQVFVKPELRHGKRKCPFISTTPIVTKKVSPERNNKTYPWDYSHFASPLLLGMQAFKKLKDDGILGNNDTKEISLLHTDVASMIRYVTADPTVLLSETVHQSRILIHQRMLLIFDRFNGRVPADSVVLQCQMLWRLMFSIDIIRNKSVVMNTIPDAVPDREMMKAVRCIINYETAVEFMSNPHYVLAKENMIKHKDLLQPVEVIPAKDDAVNLSGRGDLMHRLEKSREIIKTFIIQVYGTNQKGTLNNEQTVEIMGNLKDVVEQVVLMDKMLAVCYLCLANGNIDIQGIPWSMSKLEKENQFISDYIKKYHNGMFSITSTLRNSITNYFPHLTHHLNPCLPQYFDPMDTETTRWKKMYFLTADLSWRMFWASEPNTSEQTVIKAATPDDVVTSGISDLTITE